MRRSTVSALWDGMFGSNKRGDDSARKGDEICCMQCSWSRPCRWDRPTIITWAQGGAGKIVYAARGGSSFRSPVHES
eukprot:4270399-Pyramimonas_sp.AAC.1